MLRQDIRTEWDFMEKDAHKIHSHTGPHKNIKKRLISEGQTVLAWKHSFNKKSGKLKPFSIDLET